LLASEAGISLENIRLYDDLGVLLITVSEIQMATASERHVRRAHDHWNFRGSYNQLNEPSYDSQARRNIENFGFGGRGGGDTWLHPGDLHPSGS
jgi:hypothetical protein